MGAPKQSPQKNPMTTYALLIYRKSADPMPADDDARALAAHRALQAESEAHKELLYVARLDETSTARTVARRPNSHDVTDGPFMETKEWLVGFYVLECDDDEHALSRARQLCADDHHAIEVRPITWRAPT